MDLSPGVTAVKLTKAALTKGNIALRLAYIFRGFAHYRHGSVQADMVMEKLRVLHLDPQAAEGDCATLGMA